MCELHPWEKQYTPGDGRAMLVIFGGTFLIITVVLGTVALTHSYGAQTLDFLQHLAG